MFKSHSVFKHQKSPFQNDSGSFRSRLAQLKYNEAQQIYNKISNPLRIRAADRNNNWLTNPQVLYLNYKGRRIAYKLGS